MLRACTRLTRRPVELTVVELTVVELTVVELRQRR